MFGAHICIARQIQPGDEYMKNSFSLINPFGINVLGFYHPTNEPEKIPTETSPGEKKCLRGKWGGEINSVGSGVFPLLQVSVGKGVIA